MAIDTNTREEVLALGKHGFSYRFIAARTSLSYQQIYAVFTGHGVKLRQYRDGENAQAKEVLKRMHVNPIKRIRRKKGKAA